MTPQNSSTCIPILCPVCDDATRPLNPFLRSLVSPLHGQANQIKWLDLFWDYISITQPSWYTEPCNSSAYQTPPLPTPQDICSSPQVQDLLLNSQVVGSCSCGCSSNRWNYRPRLLLRQLISMCPARLFWMCFSVATVCQYGHKLHKMVKPSRINVLICIPSVWPAAIECKYYIPLWQRKLARVSRCIFSHSLLSPKIKQKYGWLARLLDLLSKRALITQFWS